MRRRGGFTLIEMITIIVIIAVMSALIVPEYRRVADHQQYESAEALVRDTIVRAREMAIDRDTTVTLAYNAGADSLTISADSVPAPTDVPSSVSSDNAATQQQNDAANPQQEMVSLDSEVMIASLQSSQQISGIPTTSPASQSTASQIQFYGDGTCNSATLMVISPLGYGTKITLTHAGNVSEVDQ